jgi:hypothetical protein
MLFESAVGCGPRPAAKQESAHARGLRSARPLVAVHARDLPDPLGGSSPGLGRGAEGLTLVWMRELGEPTLLLAELGEEWSEPVVVTASPRLVVNWADVPAVGETRSGRAVVAWPEHHGNDPAAGYGLRVAAATEDGRFSAEQQWSPDGVSEGPESGFAGFVDTEEGLRLVWLDGRELGGHGGHGGHDGLAGAGGTMQLRTALLDDEGQQVGPSEVLDPRTCECCKLGVSAFAGQAFVAYRDRSEAEVRDVFVAGPGLAPRQVAADGWTLRGCPVNGPAVAATPSQAWVGWYTGADDRSSTWIAASTNLREGFGPAIRFDLGLPGGRVDLLGLEDGGVLVSWLELDPANPGLAALLTRRVRADGGLGEPWFVAELGAARDWGFPRVALHGPEHAEEVVWIWTDPSGADGRPRLQAVSAPLPPA